MKVAVRKSCLAGLLLLLAGISQSQAQAPPIGQGGAAPGPAIVQRGNHAYGGGPVPHITGCGGTGSKIEGTDTAGRATLGSAWVTAGDFCFIQFAVPFPSSPICLVQAQANAAANTTPTTVVYTQDGSSIAVTSGGAPGNFIVFHCFGINPP